MKFTTSSHFQRKHGARGFTIIESLVAISILVLSIAGPLTAAYQGIAYTNIARDQVTAGFLAQDAIEYIINQKDQNFVSGATWLTGLASCTDSCKVDTLNNTIQSCGVSCSPLRFNASTGQYGYGSTSGWTDSRFTRTIHTVEILHPGDHTATEARLEVTVTWRSGLLTKSFTVRTNIFDSTI